VYVVSVPGIDPEVHSIAVLKSRIPAPGKMFLTLNVALKKQGIGTNGQSDLSKLRQSSQFGAEAGHDGFVRQRFRPRTIAAIKPVSLKAQSYQHRGIKYWRFLVIRHAKSSYRYGSNIPALKTVCCLADWVEKIWVEKKLCHAVQDQVVSTNGWRAYSHSSEAMQPGEAIPSAEEEQNNSSKGSVKRGE